LFVVSYKPQNFVSDSVQRNAFKRAVFTELQRKELEEWFDKQKYITKPDRKKLAEELGLKDSQVNSVIVNVVGRRVLF
uniref:Homeobox domain-containing protein n=1 Tax=Soboliphyme baturini TaxID=241478 RepID=A0A183IAD1_9BILA